MKGNNIVITREGEPMLIDFGLSEFTLIEHFGITNKLELFLNKKIVGMPIKYITPKTNLDNIIDDKLIELFEKYKTEIYNINNNNTN